MNPNGLVPALEVQGRVVVESLDICQFIDHTFQGPRLMPQVSVRTHHFRPRSVRLETHC